jgi:hypothetical protein
LILGGVKEDVVKFSPLFDGVEALVLLSEVLVLDDELLEFVIFGFLYFGLGFFGFVAGVD